jgi:hypothetical protein
LNWGTSVKENCVRAWALAALSMLIFGATACGKLPAGLNPADLLDEAGFNKDIEVSANLSINRNGGLVGQVPLAAAFAQAGYIAVQPNPNAAPWWTFAVHDAAVSGTVTTVVAGKRSVSRVSDEQKWTEGGLQFFAETITYSIVLNQRLQAVTQKVFEGHTLRLVAIRDPARGSWQLSRDASRGTHYGQNDALLVASELGTVGHDRLSALAGSIKDARTQAFDTIQRNLAAAGILEKDAADPNILVSRRGRHRLLHETQFVSIDKPQRGRRVLQRHQDCGERTLARTAASGIRKCA